jgi:hypothetical protein
MSLIQICNYIIPLSVAFVLIFVHFFTVLIYSFIF